MPSLFENVQCNQISTLFNGFSSYLPEFEDFAHGVAGVPRDGEGPDALAAEAEEADEEIRHAVMKGCQ